MDRLYIGDAGIPAISCPNMVVAWAVPPKIVGFSYIYIYVCFVGLAIWVLKIGSKGSVLYRG